MPARAPDDQPVPKAGTLHETLSTPSGRNARLRAHRMTGRHTSRVWMHASCISFTVTARCANVIEQLHDIESLMTLKMADLGMHKKPLKTSPSPHKTLSQPASSVKAIVHFQSTFFWYSTGEILK